jgi:hypothetical protein
MRRLAVIRLTGTIRFEEPDTLKSSGFEQTAKLIRLIKTEEKFFKFLLQKGLCPEEFVSVDGPANPFLFIIKT